MRDIYDYYDEFGQRLKKLLDSDGGVTYLKNKMVGEIVDCSITHFLIFPAKFGNVGLNSQSIWPSTAESLRKESLIRQLKTRIKEKINGGQLDGKTNPIIAVRFEDFIFMHYSSEDDIWWEENFNELENIVESVFREANNNEILGVLLYENTIKKSRFVKNPNITIKKEILKKINLLKSNGDLSETKILNKVKIEKDKYGYDKNKVKLFHEYTLEDYNKSLIIEDIVKVNLVEKTDGSFTQIGIRPLLEDDIIIIPSFSEYLPGAGRMVANGEEDYLIKNILDKKEIEKIE